MFATSSSNYGGWNFLPRRRVKGIFYACKRAMICGVLTPCGMLMHPQPSVSGLDNGTWNAVLFPAPQSKTLTTMFKLNGGLAQTQNEPCEVIVSQFSESKQEIRSIIIDSEPWFVAKDVCDALGHSNHRVAVRNLDDDEKGVRKVYPLNGKGGIQPAIVISESGLYALILRSNKPYARQFRKWITSEVIPSLRKRGHYSVNKTKKDDYVDARNVPYGWTEMNGFRVRTITIDGQDWFSINDINKALHSATGSYQLARKLNAVETLAAKIFIFGNTYPAWFANKKGLSLILSGSRKNAARLDEPQLSLPFRGGE